MIADGDGSGVGKAVGRTHHEAVEGELGVKVHGVGFFTLGLVGFQFLIVQHHQLGIGIEKQTQRILDMGGAALANGIPPEIGRRVDDQLLFIEFNDLGIVNQAETVMALSCSSR